MNVVVIPAYQPDEQLLELVKGLKENNLNILVVDDGSSIACSKLFEAVEQYAVVIHSKHNEGKGAALKKAFANVKEIFPECENVITADADGQHKIKDILRVENELKNGSEFVLTVRNLSGNVPTRSKFGNNLSRWIYAIVTGHYFVDNQSGLRGFSSKHIDWLLKVGGDKYDYEMNMLCYADKQSIQITTITIETVYIDGNKSSHFNPVADTLRIYKRLFKSLWATFVAIGNMELSMLFINIFMGYKDMLFTVPAACISSAIISIILNKFITFRRVKYSDGTRTIIHTTLRTIVYTMGCLNIYVFIPKMPIFIAFNIVALLLIPLEYLLHKIMHLSKYKDIIKER